VGLSNYSAGYCVGLLIARRVLTKLGLADTYEGVEEADGEEYRVEAEDGERRPFTCVLDTGLKRTSTGSKVFSVLKVSPVSHQYAASWTPIILNVFTAYFNLVKVA